MATLEEAFKKVVKAATHHAEVLTDHERRIQELEARADRARGVVRSDPVDLEAQRPAE